MNERMPISRIGGVELDRSVSEAERKLRIELAAAFRIAQHLGWNIDTLNHITLRIPDTDLFLMNPLGLGWDEITASSLATAAYDGKIVSHSEVRLAPAGFNFHSGILKARPDINCVIDTHEDAGAVISATTDPLLVFDQGGCRLYDEVGSHAFEGLANQEDEVPRILRDLGHRHTLIMRNHGLLTVGRTIGEAFVVMFRLEQSIEAQLMAQATGRELLVPEEEICDKAAVDRDRTNDVSNDDTWQAWMRVADQIDSSYQK